MAAFFLFFFMWSGYFSVRPVRETIGTIIGRDKLADIWIVTSIVSVLIIPHTLAVTTLGELREGAAVNLEADTLARYAARLAQFR